MSLDVAAEQAALERMATSELLERYAEVCGEQCHSRNRVYLIRRILWRLQANEYGGLSERALARAEELAKDADVRVTAPRKPRPRPGDPATAVAPEPPRLRLRPVPPESPMSDPRLPRSGTTIVRKYKSRDLTVTFRDDGVEYDGQLYKSLSAAAKAITGSHVNGFRWFGADWSGAMKAVPRAGRDARHLDEVPGRSVRASIQAHPPMTACSNSWNSMAFKRVGASHRPRPLL